MNKNTSTSFGAVSLAFFVSRRPKVQTSQPIFPRFALDFSGHDALMYPGVWANLRTRVMCLVCCFVMVALNFPEANAQTYERWIGRPTVGDYLRRDLADLMQAQQKLVSEKAKFNREIADARANFLATAENPAGRAKVEKRFADLLFVKDLTYASSIFLTEGFTDASRNRSQALDAFTGGPLDNGIPADARFGFEAWVNGIRASLGAKRADDLVFLGPGDVKRFRAALEANEPLYLKYKEQRDLAEIMAPIKLREQAIEISRRENLVKEARTTDGSVHLHNQEVKQIHNGAYRLDLLNPTLRRQLATVAKARQQQVLDCTYGPVMTARRELGYGTYTFWYKTPPPDIAAYLQIDREHALERIGAVAMTNCPASEKEAIAAHCEAIAAHPWFEAKRACNPAAAPVTAKPAVDTTGMTPAEARAAHRRR